MVDELPELTFVKDKEVVTSKKGNKATSARQFAITKFWFYGLEKWA